MVIIVLSTGLFSTTGMSASREVTVWTFNSSSETEWKTRQADIEKVCQISLKIVLVPQHTFIQKLQTSMADGREYPDLIEWMIENNQILAADPKKSLVAPLEKWTSTSKVFQNVIPGRISYLKYGKHIYGLPRDAHPCVLVYNDTVWKSVGVDVASLETWDDFFIAAQKLTAEKKDGRPVHYALPENWGLSGTMFMIMQQSGAQILDKEGQRAFTSPEFKTFAQKWFNWLKTGTMCYWDWGNFGSMLKDGSLASFIAPDWWISQVDQAAQAGQYQFRVRPLPYYKKGGPRTASWGGTFLAMVKMTKNQDQLYKVMEYMQYGDGKVLTDRYKQNGLVTPLKSVWDDPVFYQVDPRFGGQKLGELQVALANEMPGINNGDILWDAINDFNENILKLHKARSLRTMD